MPKCTLLVKNSYFINLVHFNDAKAKMLISSKTNSFFQISVQKFQNKTIFVSIFLFFSNSIKLCISAKTKVLISNLTIAFSSYSLKGPKAIFVPQFFFNMKFRILTKLTVLISNMSLVFFSNYCLEVHKYGILGSRVKGVFLIYIKSYI